MVPYPLESVYFFKEVAFPSEAVDVCHLSFGLGSYEWLTGHIDFTDADEQVGQRRCESP